MSLSKISAIYPTNSGLTNYVVSVIAFDTLGNKWIGTRGSGVLKFEGTTWTSYASSNSGLAGLQGVFYFHMSSRLIFTVLPSVACLRLFSIFATNSGSYDESFATSNFILSASKKALTTTLTAMQENLRLVKQQADQQLNWQMG